MRAGMALRQAAACAAAWACVGAAWALPSYDKVRQAYRASDIVVQDRAGKPLQRVRADFHGRRGDWLALRDISPALRRAVVLSEDRRFRDHEGVDWRAVAAAAWGGLVHGQRRGASTLTMQLVGLVDTRFRRTHQRRSLAQKLDQAIQAQALEQLWTKDQILEAYLNLVSFRGELVGVDSLSRVLFQKHASGLDARESALAAVMLRGPNAPADVLARRACGLLRQMEASGECGGLADFVQISLLRRAAARGDSEGLAPHFARWVLGQHRLLPGQAVRTSIDAGLQRFVIEDMNRRLRALSRSNVRDAAVVVLDNATGQVLAYVGSSGPLSQAAWVDHARALRQAGSTLKPFLYAQAIEQQRLTAVSLLHDSPLNLATGNGLYIPRNYDEMFSGWVSVRTALASSLNIPAVRALTMVTPDAFQQRLAQLGLPLDRSGDFYGYSLALGSADVSLLTLSNAYRALANQGFYSPVQTQPLGLPPVDTRRVMPAAAAWIVGDVLADRHARARTFGLDSPLGTPFWSAVKTGTSKDMRDNWCIGWSQYYTVGVWAGNSSGDSMRDVSGVTGAGPIWHDVMMRLHARTDSRQPAMPPGVTARKVSFEDGEEPPRRDYFVGDTALDVVSRSRLEAAEQDAAPRIARPVDGTILALDPDIPPENQRLWLRAVNVAARTAHGVSWRIGDEALGTGGQASWLPRPGRHRVELLDAAGKVLDSVTVQVRGAQARKPL